MRGEDRDFAITRAIRKGVRKGGSFGQPELCGSEEEGRDE